MAHERETVFRQISLGSVEWEIKNFKDVCSGNNEKMVSPTFWVFNTRWQIKLFPNGNSEADKDFISCFVYKVKGKDPVLTTIMLSIKVNEYKVRKLCFEHIFKETENRGYAHFVERSEVLKHLTPASLYDSIKVVCSVFYPCDIQKDVSTQTLNINDSVNILTKNFEDLFLSKSHSNVNIKVKSKDYPAHKAILVARSPVFSAMFEHEMKENINGVVDITDCDTDSFELFLKFLYTGNVGNLTNNTCIDLYKIADKHGLSDLKETCCSFMCENLEIDSICDVLELAITYAETELLKEAINFFTVNAMDIFVTESWQNFMNEKTLIGSEILKKMAASKKYKIVPKV